MSANWTKKAADEKHKISVAKNICPKILLCWNSPEITGSDWLSGNLLREYFYPEFLVQPPNNGDDNREFSNTNGVIFFPRVIAARRMFPAKLALHKPFNNNIRALCQRTYYNFNYFTRRLPVKRAIAVNYESAFSWEQPCEINETIDVRGKSLRFHCGVEKTGALKPSLSPFRVCLCVYVCETRKLAESFPTVGEARSFRRKILFARRTCTSVSITVSSAWVTDRKRYKIPTTAGMKFPRSSPIKINQTSRGDLYGRNNLPRDEAPMEKERTRWRGKYNAKQIEILLISIWSCASLSALHDVYFVRGNRFQRGWNVSSGNKSDWPGKSLFSHKTDAKLSVAGSFRRTAQLIHRECRASVALESLPNFNGKRNSVIEWNRTNAIKIVLLITFALP